LSRGRIRTDDRSRGISESLPTMSQSDFQEPFLLPWTPAFYLAPLVWFVLIKEKCLKTSRFPSILLALI